MRYEYLSNESFKKLLLLFHQNKTPEIKYLKVSDLTCVQDATLLIVKLLQIHLGFLSLCLEAEQKQTSG